MRSAVISPVKLIIFLLLDFSTLYGTSSSVKALIEAVREGNLNKIKKLVNKSNRVNERDATGYTPLGAAVANGDNDIVAYLLSKGASPDKETAAYISQPEVPDSVIITYSLIIAASTANDKAVSLLLSYDADPNIMSKMAVVPGHEKTGGVRYTPLMFAAIHCKRSMAHVLIKAGARVDAQDYKWRTALHWVAENNCLPIAQDILKKDPRTSTAVSWSMTRKKGKIPYEIAQEWSNKEMMMLLYPYLKASLLVQAVQIGDLDKVRAFIQKGGNLDWVDSDGNTALGAAIIAGHNTIVAELLQAGASPDVPTAISYGSSDRQPPLFLAIQHSNEEALALLLDYHAKVNMIPPTSSTPLGEAAVYCKTSMAKRLLAAGANPAEGDYWQTNALHQAIGHNCIAVAYIILDFKASLMYVRDSFKRRPLDLVQSDEMKLLLDSYRKPLAR